MIALLLCVVAFGAAYWAGKRSLAYGLIALLAFGDFYGIVRANMLSTASYFIFDSAMIGLYASQKWSASVYGKQSSSLRTIVLLLLIWPTLLVLLPSQPLLVSLVGLRSAIFFLPTVLLGSRLRARDLEQLSIGMVVLNLVALGFAVAEYFKGVPAFFPRNAATFIIYASADVAGGFFRIPSIFSSAHAFGGTMVATLPYLIGAWSQAKTHKLRTFALVGAAAAFIGILLSATRLNFVIGVGLILVAFWNGRLKARQRMVFVLVVAGMAAVALDNPRLERFKSLSNADAVEDRIAGSVNKSFFEILITYPLGNGLGGGGTNMPYFLKGEVRNPISMENEYARILSEQGVIGLGLWVAFILWFLSRTPVAFMKSSWATTRRMIWGLCIFGLISGLVGLGLLSSIPEAALLLMGLGFISTPMEPERPTRSQISTTSAVSRYAVYQPAGRQL